MERRSSLARRAALAGTALLLVVGLAGCDGKSPVGRGPVATVEGHDITLDDLREIMDAQVSYVEAVGGSETSGIPTSEIEAVVARYEGDNEHTIGTGGAAEVLNVMVEVEVLRSMLEAADGEVTDADRSTARAAIEQQITGSGVTATAELEPLIELETERASLTAALQRALADDEAREAELREIFEANRASFDRACIQQLPTADEADARTAAQRLDAGEDFVEVAGELSIQPEIAAPGNPATCIPRYQLAGVFGEDAATVATGERLGPADAQGAWLIIQVWAEEEATFEDARADIESQVPDGGQAAFAEARAEAFAEASVSVDARFGRWDPESGRVIAPTDPLADPT